MSGRLRIIIEGGEEKDKPEPMFSPLYEFEEHKTEDPQCIGSKNTETHFLNPYRQYNIILLDHCGNVVKKINLNELLYEKE